MIVSIKKEIFLISFLSNLSFQRFKFTLFSEKTKDFFLNLVTYTMKDREQKKIIRPDMIHLLMEAKKGKYFSYVFFRLTRWAEGTLC